jgi:hypothetical protein
MTFLNPVFIYLLPLAIVPLLIALALNLNRKRLEFPSTELIAEILSRDLSKRKLVMRLKQLLRVLILAILVMAFSAPVITRSPDKNRYTVIIDNTVSMKRFPLDDIIERIEAGYNIDKIYFGTRPLDKDTIQTLRYQKSAIDFTETVTSVVSREKIENLIIVTDGQKVNFPRSRNNIGGINRLKALILSDNSRNIYVKDMSKFPAVSLPGVSTSFTVNIGGDIKKSDRITVYIGDETVLSETARPRVEFSRFIDKSGLNYGKVVLEGDNFTNDNIFYFPIIAAPKPRVYFGIDNPIPLRVISSIFPEFFRTDNPRYADIIIASSLPYRITDKPVFLFCENETDFQNTLRRDFSYLIEFRSDTLTGNIKSGFEILNSIRDFTIKTRFAHRESLISQPLALVNNIPVVTLFDNYTVFNFSIRENQTYLENSAFPLLVLNEVIISHYRDRFITEKKTDETVYYDIDGNIAVPDIPGIYRERDSSKFLVVNIEQESEFDFYDQSRFARLFDNPIDFIETEKPLKDIYLAFAGMVALLALLFVEIFL